MRSVSSHHGSDCGRVGGIGWTTGFAGTGAAGGAAVVVVITGAAAAVVVGVVSVAATGWAVCVTGLV